MNEETPDPDVCMTPPELDPGMPEYRPPAAERTADPTDQQCPAEEPA